MEAFRRWQTRLKTRKKEVAHTNGAWELKMMVSHEGGRGGNWDDADATTQGGLMAEIECDAGGAKLKEDDRGNNAQQRV